MLSHTHKLWQKILQKSVEKKCLKISPIFAIEQQDMIHGTTQQDKILHSYFLLGGKRDVVG